VLVSIKPAFRAALAGLFLVTGANLQPIEIGPGCCRERDNARAADRLDGVADHPSMAFQVPVRERKIGASVVV
jgi:hypothetical protein